MISKHIATSIVHWQLVSDMLQSLLFCHLLTLGTSDIYDNDETRKIWMSLVWPLEYSSYWEYGSQWHKSE